MRTLNEHHIIHVYSILYQHDRNTILSDFGLYSEDKYRCKSRRQGAVLRAAH